MADESDKRYESYIVFGRPKPTTVVQIKPPSEAVRGLQDQVHGEADFLRDLEKATRRTRQPS